ncbi:TonB-dependent siderophore receptor [Billgrantia gudaonensis]|uniref:Outer-membrane receptor for ferric coprogen and ferric-rhodotorulic acid n=1 Tax=Billgrantia gudaonensis TaxID=376427 RepID=A0A1G8SNG9_9GAMM|nr:TonB-dependent siderophore receptor [Halomonas gudaonensis]SDJ30798.1 outer-membrane receptor for ferric coprogen and ferric-rhodotorulic acid [Halomonas gudaonensis]
MTLHNSDTQPRRRARPRMLALAIHLAAAGVIVQPLWPAAAIAQPTSQSQVRQYDIPAGPVSTALNRFAAQSGILISGAGELGEGRRSPGLQGRHDVEEGLQRLLAGTGLAAERGNDGSYRLEELPDEVELSPIEVAAERYRGSLTEGSDSYTSNRVTIGKQGLSLKEMPQSVSVITRARMNDQNMTTLDDVLTRTTGITKRNFGPTASIFRSRGYEIDTMLLDGTPIDSAIGVTDTMFDTAVLDRVEVLRGPGGLIQGSGEPSGTVNLARKRAQEKFGFQTTLSYGSWDAYRSEVDVTGALDDAGRLRGRLVGVYDDRHHFIDHVYTDKTIGYGTLEYDLTPRTTVSVGLMDQSGDSRPNYGLPQLANGSLLDIDRSTYHGSLWDVKDESIERYFAELEHQLDNGGSFRLIANHIERETDTLQSTAGVSTPTSNSDDIDIWQWRIINPREDNFVDATLSTPFELAGKTHGLMMGASHRVTEDQTFWGSGDPQFIQRNLADPDPDTPKPTFDVNHTRDVETQETSVYSQLRFDVIEDTTLIAGGQVSWWESKDRLNSANNFEVDSEFTPYAGLIYDIDDRVSAYASYTEIFQPQSSQKVNGDFLDPRTGQQFEVGLKGEYMNGTFNWHAAVFQITDKNRGIADPDNPAFSIAEGEAESKGVELEISGRLMPRWEISAGYAYTQTEYVNDPEQEGQPFSTDTPEHDLKLWTRYRFSDNPNRGWRVGAGLNYSSSIYAEAMGTRWEQGGYTTISSLIGYRVNRNLDFSLTGNNLTDKKYFETVRANTRNNYYGDPRNFMLTMRYQY